MTPLLENAIRALSGYVAEVDRERAVRATIAAALADDEATVEAIDAAIAPPISYGASVLAALRRHILGD